MTNTTDNATTELRKSFRSATLRLSKAKAFRAMIDAVCAKIDNSTLSVSKQAVRHAKTILQNMQYLESVNAVDSVNAFFSKAKNIKAIAYIALLSSQSSNNYLTLTMQHIAQNKNATTETVAKMLAQYYSEATASAQKSMSVNALRALRAIDFDDTSKAAISRAENFDAVLEICKSHSVTRNALRS